MLPFRPSSLCLGGSVTLAATLVSGAVWAQAGAVHQHGVGHLDLAVQGQSLELQIRSPGMDLLGFEHAPRTAAERQSIEQLRRALVENKGLVVPTPTALCTLVSAEESQDDHEDEAHGDDHPHEHGHAKADPKSDHSQEHGHQHHHGKAESHDATHAHDHDDAHGHGDWVVNYRYECQQPAQLRGVSLGWFKAFPGASEIHYQAITPTGQTGGKLTPQQPEIRW